MNKKFSFTKLIVAFVCVMFIATLIYVMRQPIGDYEEMALYAAALTVTGSILLTTLIYYSKKSQAENLQKIKSGYYEQAMEIRVNYEREILELMEEFGVDRETIISIEESAEFDEVSDEAFYDGADSLQNIVEEVQSEAEIQEVQS